MHVESQAGEERDEGRKANEAGRFRAILQIGDASAQALDDRQARQDQRGGNQSQTVGSQGRELDSGQQVAAEAA